MATQSSDQHILPIKPANSTPVLPPQFAKDYEAYLLAMKLYHQAIKKLEKMAAGLKHMKNVMYGALQIMNMFQEVEGGKMRALSAVDNMDSDIRRQVSEAQGDVNQIAADADGSTEQTPSKKEIDEATNLVKLVKQIQSEVDLIKSNKELGGSDVAKNLEEAIKGIKGAFTANEGKGKTKNFWGDPKDMAALILTYVNESKGTGTYSPQLKDLQFGFQQLTQTTSALSTTTNTNLQFTADMFKQFLGTEQSSMEAYQKGNAQMVQNQKSN